MIRDLRKCGNRMNNQNHNRSRRQLVRDEVNEFFSSAHLLSDDELLEFLSPGAGPEVKEEPGERNDPLSSSSSRTKIGSPWKARNEVRDERILLRRAFHRRRAEIRALAADLREGRGGVRIDEDGRLVRGTGPMPPQNDANNPENNTNDGGNANNNNNDNGNPPLLFPGNINNNNNNNPLDAQQENPEEQFYEQQRREAETTISLAVKEIRMRQQRTRNLQAEGTEDKDSGDDEDDDFEVILLDPLGRPVMRPSPAAGGGFFGAARHDHANINANAIPNPFRIAIDVPLRRLVIALLVATTAVVCALLQILPIPSLGAAMEPSFNPQFDPLLRKVLEIREWRDHVRECNGGLSNRTDSSALDGTRSSALFPWMLWLPESIVGGPANTSDCSRGVLHVPSRKVMNLDSLESVMDSMKHGTGPARLESALWDYEPGAENVTWFLPCVGHPTLYLPYEEQTLAEAQCTNASASASASTSDAGNQRRRRIFDRCFRGIHDNLVETREIRAALSLGDALIEDGGDHFDVHYDVSLLTNAVPSIVERVKHLLDTNYLNQHHQHPRGPIANDDTARDAINNNNNNNNAGFFEKTATPVAFRVLTTGPMDGHDVKLKQNRDGLEMYLAHSRALNETNYLEWVLESRKHNDRARHQSYYRPWPFRLQPTREICDLRFDLEADSRFCIRTSVHLTSGAGGDYRGGTSLFVDDHPSNFGNPGRRIARGVSIDGSRGRIVVSTGGLENLQCRFPTRSGFRTVLQIWWNCEGEDQ